MNVLSECYEALFEQLGSQLFHSPLIKSVTPAARQALRQCERIKAVINATRPFKVRVQKKASICLKAGALTMVPVTCPQLESVEFLLEPLSLEEEHLPAGLLVFPTLVCARKGLLYAPVVNVNNAEVTRSYMDPSDGMVVMYGEEGPQEIPEPARPSVLDEREILPENLASYEQGPGEPIADQGANLTQLSEALESPRAPSPDEIDDQLEIAQQPATPSSVSGGNRADVLFLSNFLQYFLGIPRRSQASWEKKTLQRLLGWPQGLPEATRGHPYQVPEPAQLAPLNLEEQRFYSEAKPNHPVEEPHFGHLYLGPYSFGHDPEFMTIAGCPAI
ncbi:hypothetical protein N1851_003937 [Merluccius polli]|uniref:Uncharacterized protein n=1 Tax=Merluccius polli TaxID=89951 RepID=A0AA47N8Q6_MERPO|nr:hypothetical protein N1851_003937 [Merluccius polli]